ncbi:MAG: hypothetical protein MK135_02445 [Polyangiaceae bacterium]|nr:hypothetical protein [Polyangiaceae bacterium]
MKGVVYRSNEVQFELGARMPGARQIHSDDALVTWQNDVAGTTVAVNARCGLDGDDVPLEALIHHLLIQFTDREEVVRRPFILDDRAALRVDEMANLDGVRRYLSMIVLKKDGCVYDFIHIDGQLAFDGIAPEVETSRRNFLLMVEGFHTL